MNSVNNLFRTYPTPPKLNNYIDISDNLNNTNNVDTTEVIKYNII